jgi:hypothetical protein
MTRPPYDRRRSGSSRRRVPSRPRKATVLIVCEGKETEPNYFDRLKRDEPAWQHFAITVKRGRGGSRQGIAQFAVDRKNDFGADYDHVWCVMDVEGPETLDEMQKALELLNANSISAALSNPTFEVWLLAHFERTGTSFLNCGQVIARLNGQWRRSFDAEYDKADTRIYERVAPLTDKALEHAKWVREQHHDADKCIMHCNSATDVYRLVGLLRKRSV